jgi:hypothetical protein
MRRFTAKIAKLVLAVVFFALGVDMYIHPVESDYFFPGGRFSGPHTRHLSEGDMKFLGIMIVMFGLGLVYSAFYGSRK